MIPVSKCSKLVIAIAKCQRAKILPMHALHHKTYLTLSYVTSLRDSFCLGTLRTCSLKNNAFSVLRYVIKVTLHYMYLHSTELNVVAVTENVNTFLLV